jgi:acetyl esterase
MTVQRAAAARLSSFLGRLAFRPGRQVASVTDHMIPVEGGNIMVRLYRPYEGRLPLHVFFHGGGWCTGTVAERDNRCQDIAVDANCVVASVDYRLAPENQYPTAPEDCYAALVWLVERAEELRLNPDIVSVGGESAGGNLAAVVCLMARDRSGPALAFQLLDIPATDLTMSQPSVHELGTGYLLTLEAMRTYVGNYIADPARITEPYASPLHAQDLSGLPPAFIMTAEYDPLRDDGRAYAARLEEAGVPVELRQLAGHVHGSFAFTRLLDSARRCHDDSVRALSAAYDAARLKARSSA